MSLPSLPLDVIIEIVSHLESSLHNDRKESIEAGKSISLVSRTFRSIGQALRWRHIAINLPSVTSLARHFNLYPHLAKLVRFFEQLDRYDPVDVENESILHKRLLRVLTETRELRGLKLGGDMEDDVPEQVFQIASSLQRLETCALNVFGICRWTPEMTTALLKGFPRLKETYFFAVGLSVQEDHRVLASSPESLKRLSHVGLSFPSKATDVPRFVDLFFGALDLSVLRTCRLGRAAGVLSYQKLARCPKLSGLNVFSGLTLDSTQEELSELVAQLPQLQCIKTLNFHVITGQVIDSDIRIDSILAALPPGLLRFSALELSFDDYESIPIRPLPESSYTEHPTFEALHPSASGYRPLLIWKETEEGREKWYRSIPAGRTWSEVKAE
ncbi:hypothetical protein JCM3765_006470 [Sporobolomyces pararoseus]